jgi:5,10-methylenetetrahydromethanopterin reductase
MPDVGKVPVEVAATGSRMIAAAARHAEGVDLALGAALEQLAPAIELARTEAPGEISLGAFVNVAVHPDRQVARQLVRGNVAIFAAFRHDAPEGQPPDDEFIDRFAIAGPADEVTERLKAIGGAGIDRLIVVPGSLDAGPAAQDESNQRFAVEVLPRLTA